MDPIESTTATAPTPGLLFGADVDASVRHALSRDPEFVHPEFVDTPVWVIRDGSPRAVPVVGRTSRPLRRPLLTIRDRHVVRTVEHYFMTRDEAATAQAELDESLDL